MSMRWPFVLPASALAACAVAMGAFASDVYRWVDANGTVHYSDSPPQGGDAAKARIVPQRVSTVPMPLPSESALRRSEAERIATLERELADERASRAAQARADEDAYRRWLEQCERDRRVDCDETLALAVPYPVTRFGVRPGFPYFKRPAHLPRIGPGPAGIGATYVTTHRPQRPPHAGSTQLRR